MTTIDISEFREVIYANGQKLFFHKAHKFHNHFGHQRKTIKFRFHKNILLFLESHPEINIYFTLDDQVKPFKKIDEGFLIDMVSYYDFCKTIGSKTGGRAQAFLGQNLSIKDVDFTDADKDEFIRANASESNLLEAIKNLDPETKKRILDSMVNVEQKDLPAREAAEISQDDFMAAFSNFLKSPSLQSEFYKKLPYIQIETLKSHILFLRNNLDKNETFIQNWIDEDGGKYRKQRCLIFGLDYVDPKREGQLSAKRFDLLAEQDLEHHVIFELKSPKDDIFKVASGDTAAGGKTTEYNISPQLARAVPEVLGYKRLYEQATSEELQKMGIKTRKPVRKCVIVLGTKVDDPVWKDNFESLASCLNGIELITYNHLIERLENTVKNLEDNTSELV